MLTLFDAITLMWTLPLLLATAAAVLGRDPRRRADARRVVAMLHNRQNRYRGGFRRSRRSGRQSG